jgi:hypothetical protein
MKAENLDLARAYDLVQQVQSLNAEIATLKQAAHPPWPATAVTIP